MDTVKAKAPMHLWIVGILSALWNGFGAFDYFMTRTKGEDYIQSMMPTADVAGIMTYIDSFPIYVSLGWGIGVWGGLAGSLLLLARSRHAVIAFALSALGAIVGVGWQLLNPAPVAAMHDGFNAAMPYVIIAIAIALFVYARAQRAKGVLS